MMKAYQGIQKVLRESLDFAKADRTDSSYFEIFSEIELPNSQNCSPEMVKMPELQWSKTANMPVKIS